MFWFTCYISLVEYKAIHRCREVPTYINMPPDCHLVMVVLLIPCLVFCCLAVVILYAVIVTYYHITNQIWTHIGREHGGILSRATRLGWAHVWWPGTAVYAMVTSFQLITCRIWLYISPIPRASSVALPLSPML